MGTTAQKENTLRIVFTHYTETDIAELFTRELNKIVTDYVPIDWAQSDRAKFFANVDNDKTVGYVKFPSCMSRNGIINAITRQPMNYVESADRITLVPSVSADLYGGKESLSDLNTSGNKVYISVASRLNSELDDTISTINDFIVGCEYKNGILTTDSVTDFLIALKNMSVDFTYDEHRGLVKITPM